MTAGFTGTGPRPLAGEERLRRQHECLRTRARPRQRLLLGEIVLSFRQVGTTVEPLVPEDARQLLLEAGESGSFVISEAVLSSLRDRGLSYGDVRNALAHVKSATPRGDPAEKHDGRDGSGGWTVVGPTMDGEQMTVTVAIESGIVMVI